MGFGVSSGFGSFGGPSRLSRAHQAGGWLVRWDEIIDAQFALIVCLRKTPSPIDYLYPSPPLLHLCHTTPITTFPELTSGGMFTGHTRMFTQSQWLYLAEPANGWPLRMSHGFLKRQLLNFPC